MSIESKLKSIENKFKIFALLHFGPAPSSTLTQFRFEPLTAFVFIHVVTCLSQQSDHALDEPSAAAAMSLFFNGGNGPKIRPRTGFW